MEQLFETSLALRSVPLPEGSEAEYWAAMWILVDLIRRRAAELMEPS